jgi:hypothetical protein
MSRGHLKFHFDIFLTRFCPGKLALNNQRAKPPEAQDQGQ